MSKNQVKRDTSKRAAYRALKRIENEIYEIANSHRYYGERDTLDKNLNYLMVQLHHLRDYHFN